ncbi:hypothetical protein D3C85_1751440 [compost metagenome]
MDVVLTGPLHTHGLARKFLGENGRFDDEVWLGFAPEAASEQGHVESDLIEWQPKTLADPFTGDLRRLTRPPRFTRAILVAGDGDHRLHR